MGFYDRHILPHLINCACGTPAVMAERARLIPEASGRVLEMGIGTGLNLAYYDATKVSHVCGVDPAAAMHELARKRAAVINIPVETVALELEQIAAPAASFDTVVTTFTLCTIPDVAGALKEMRRVLKPEGLLLFCEHGLGPTDSVRSWQRRLTPLWKPIAGGCHLDRDIPRLLAEAGFRVTELETHYIQGPKPMTWIYRGRAVVG